MRAYLQHLYLHTPEQLALLNTLYEEMWLYYNFFQPVLRQTARVVHTDAQGVCRIRRTQDQAKTPLKRLLQARPPISTQTAKALRALYDQTNPRQLNLQIHEHLAHLYRLAEQDERRNALGPGKIII